MSVPAEEVAGLVGHAFPGGTVTIARWENVLLCDVMGVDPAPDGIAHPAFLFHLPLAGAGLSIAELLELGRAESEEAVRAGEYRWQVHGPLRVDVPYRVDGQVVAVERKRGRRAGVMDALTFRLDVDEAATGARIATTHTTCLFLRSQ